MSDAAELGLPIDDRRLLDALPSSSLLNNGIPSEAQVWRRQAALQLVRSIVGDQLVDEGLRHSILGPQWSSDFDLHVRQAPSAEVLLASGWLPIDGLLRSIGRNGDDRWIVRDDQGRALVIADFERGPRPDAVEATIARARRRGQVRVREVLELRALQRAGRALPVHDPVVLAAGRAEAALGGHDLPTSASGEPVLPPVPLPAPRAPSRPRRPGVARRRYVVAVSGVDGSGKSTLASAVRAELEILGIEVSQVWARPGIRLSFLGRVASSARRILRQTDEPAMQRVTKGLPAATPSRRGLLGWLWALLVTLAFLRDVWGQHLRTRGVVIYDRHVLDAEVTLAFVYDGVDLRFHRWLVRAAMPRADLAVYLGVNAAVASARKPQDTFGPHAIAGQLDVYARRLPTRPDIHVLEPDSVAALVARVLELMATTAETTP